MPGRSKATTGCRKLVLTLISTTLGVLGVGGATAAAAEQIEFKVTDSWVLLDVPGNPIPMALAATPQGGFPLTMTGDLDKDGSFTLPATEFLIRPMVSGSQTDTDPAFAADSDMTGKLDRETGVMNLQIPLKYVLGFNNPNPTPDTPRNLTCSYSGFDMEMSTAGESGSNQGVFAASPFGPGGSLLGAWTTTTSALGENVTPSVESGRSICNLYIATLPEETFAGKVWLEGTVDVVKKAPAPPRIKLAFKPLKRKVRPGGSTKFRLRVRNFADTQRKTKISYSSSKPWIKVPKPITVTVPANSALVANVRVKLSRKVRGKAKVTARAAGKTVGVLVVAK